VRGVPTIVCCSIIAGALLGVAPAAGAGSSTQTGTAPQQLVHAYPLGPQRLCCAGHSASAASSATGGSQPAGSPSQRPASSSRSAGQPAHVAGRSGQSGRSPSNTHQSGSSPLIWIVLGAVVAALLATGMAVVHRMNRRLAHALRVADAAAQPIDTLKPDSLLAAGEPDRRQQEAKPSAEPDSPTGPHLPKVAAATEPTELAYRRADRHGDADAAFNLGVLLHERGDFAGAAAAYQRAEQRGDRDAPFNLGVLLYEAGDFEGAQRAWRRAVQWGNTRAEANLEFLRQRRREQDPAERPEDAMDAVELALRRADERGDAKGAFNLGVLLHGRQDFVGAAAAYERAEERGDPDAAFNLGVVLYEAGDRDGAEAAFRRGAQRGNAQAQANLRFLLESRADLERAHHP
jgi:tetratricopeptide (TPR) repeat protein